jgi:hypothetical protein
VSHFAMPARFSGMWFQWRQRVRQALGNSNLSLQNQWGETGHDSEGRGLGESAHRERRSCVTYQLLRAQGLSSVSLIALAQYFPDIEQYFISIGKVTARAVNFSFSD